MRFQLNFWTSHPLPPFLEGGGKSAPPRHKRTKIPGTNRVKHIWQCRIVVRICNLCGFQLSVRFVGLWGVKLLSICGVAGMRFIFAVKRIILNFKNKVQKLVSSDALAVHSWQFCNWYCWHCWHFWQYLALSKYASIFILTLWSHLNQS